MHCPCVRWSFYHGANSNWTERHGYELKVIQMLSECCSNVFFQFWSGPLFRTIIIRAVLVHWATKLGEFFRNRPATQKRTILFRFSAESQNTPRKHLCCNDVIPNKMCDDKQPYWWLVFVFKAQSSIVFCSSGIRSRRERCSGVPRADGISSPFCGTLDRCIQNK